MENLAEHTGVSTKGCSRFLHRCLCAIARHGYISSSAWQSAFQFASVIYNRLVYVGALIRTLMPLRRRIQKRVCPPNEVAAPRFAIAIELKAVGSLQDLSALIVCCDLAQSLGGD